MASYVTTNTANWGLTKLSCAQDGKYFRLGNGGEGVIIHVLDDGYNPVESPYKYYPGATPVCFPCLLEPNPDAIPRKLKQQG